MEPSTGITTAHHSWKIITRIRQLFQQAEKIGEIVLHISDLQKRVAELEKRLERAPGEACPHCGALAFRVHDSAPAGMGRLRREMKCGECGFEEEHFFDPLKQPPGRK
jgi:predicted Zn-ribbon and HTH transcriptional regulator